MTALPQPLAIYAITAVGAELARTLALSLPGSTLFLPRALAYPPDDEVGFERLTQALAANYQAYGGHVVLAAAGIVVRALAPLLRGKTQDPAVVVVDQAGRYAVSLLSGHLGGANALARRVAEILGGQAVITTATDSAGLPSLEMLAGELGFRVDNLGALAKVSMAMLDGGHPPVCDPQGWLWPVLERRWPGRFDLLPAGQEGAGDQSLIWVGYRLLSPPPAWLVLRPPALVLGLGCNRGTSADEMEAFIRQTLEREGLSAACLAALASVRAKEDEPGLIELATRLSLPIIFFSAEELAAVEVPNPSPTVARHMGVASVCEAAAMLAAGSRQLLIPKQKSLNVTLALALTSPPASSTS